MSRRRKNTLEVHVGHDPEDTRTRFLAAIARAESGNPIEPERHLTFEDWDTLVGVMSGKRLELLRHVRRAPPRSIRALAGALGRGYSNVHGDVVALANVGLLDISKDGIRAPFASVEASIELDSGKAPA